MAVPFTFVNYDRISDTLLWLGKTGNFESVVLKFCVDLVKQDMNGNEKHFHSEYKYYSKKFERYSQSITRNYNCYFVINTGLDNMGAVLHISDVQILNLVIESSILPWFIGNTRIFSMKDDKMVILKDYTEVTVPLNERSYLRFSPVTINFEDQNVYKEGVRLEINDSDNCIDITVDKFMEFVYILRNTDMINLAANMINYVKIPPYNVNLRTNNNGNFGSNQSVKVGNYFDK